MTLVPPSIVVPLAGALLLALLPAGIGRRGAVATGLVVGLVTLALSAIAPFRPPAATGLWLSDRLAVSLPVLAAIPAVLVGAWQVSLPPSASRQGAGGRLRRSSAAVPLLVGGAILACRAAPLFLMLIGVAILALAACLLLSRRPHVPALFASMLLTSWLGAAILSTGLGGPAGWISLPAGYVALHPALRLCGLLFLLLPMLLLAWPVAWAVGGREAATPDERCAQALLPVLLAIPGFDMAVRLRALPEPDPGLLRLDIVVIVGAGLLGMLLAVALLPGRRRLADRLVLTASVQLGAALVGIGVNGTGGIAAALTILFFLALAAPVALLPAGPPVGAGMRRLAALVLAGLPPFGPFAAAFALLLRLSAGTPVLALLLLASLVAAGLSLLRPLHQLELDPAPAPRGVPALLPGLVALGVLAWLGLAMPVALSDWLLGLSEAAAGAAWPAAGPPR